MLQSNFLLPQKDGRLNDDWHIQESYATCAELILNNMPWSPRFTNVPRQRRSFNLSRKVELEPCDGTDVTWLQCSITHVIYWAVVCCLTIKRKSIDVRALVSLRSWHSHVRHCLETRLWIQSKVIFHTIISQVRQITTPKHRLLLIASDKAYARYYNSARKLLCIKAPLKRM